MGNEDKVAQAQEENDKAAANLAEVKAEVAQDAADVAQDVADKAKEAAK